MVECDPRRPLIHVGYHKTGTSWLQRHLFGRTDVGFTPLDTNWLSRHASQPTAPKSLGWYFVYSSDGTLLSPFLSRTREIHALLEGSENRLAGCPVISNERLSGNPHAAGFDAPLVADRIKEAFPTARILIVIREQVSMTLSCYYQYLKRGGTANLRAYICGRYDGARPGFSPEHLRYNLLIQYYQRLFGENNVLIVPYEWFRSTPEDFLGRILSFADLDPCTGLPVEAKANVRTPSNRWSLFRFRRLNIARRSDSLNGHSQFARFGIPVITNGMIRASSRLCPDRAARSLLARQHALVTDIYGSRYSESNIETERLTGLDLRGGLGYR